MKCMKCGKEISVPLKLYDGMLACSKCCNPLSFMNDSKPTPENTELFELGKEAYFFYLTKDHNAQIYDKKADYKKQAISLIEESSNLGNPFARLYLAELYENYDFAGLNIDERYKKSFNLLANLALNLDSMDFNDDRGAIDKLNKDAARNLFELYVRHNETFSTSSEFEDIINQAKQKYPKLASEISFGKSTSSISAVYRFIASFNNKKRAPLFGLFFLKGKELKELLSFTLPDAGFKTPIPKLTSNTMMSYLNVPSLGQSNDSAEKNRFRNIRSESNFISEFSDVKDNECFYIFFLNDKGKHKYLSKSKIDKIKGIMENAYCEQLNFLIHSNIKDQFYYDDDVYYYLKTEHTIDNAIKKLVRKVCGEQ